MEEIESLKEEIRDLTKYLSGVPEKFGTHGEFSDVLDTLKRLQEELNERMAGKKYVCCGGYVVSNVDGDEHYISAFRLVRLYNLNPRECILIDHNDPHNFLGQDFTGLTFLYPRRDGNYTL